MIKNFSQFYDCKKTFEQFVLGKSNYMIKLELESESVEMSLEKKNSGFWEGKLTCYKSTNLSESIPIRIDNEELVIKSLTEKRVNLKNVLLFKNINSKKLNMENAVKDSFDIPTESIIGGYPIEDLQWFMKEFYDIIISCFETFESERSYFSAIDKLESVKYNKHGFEFS